jgi:poly(A) polymerase
LLTHSPRPYKLPLEMTTSSIRHVFEALEAKGGVGCVRFVGGCVRNLVMGHLLTDIDLATQLTPDETEMALSQAGIKSVPTGKAFGTISSIIDSNVYEITSLREDVETDGRRAVVKYTDNWTKDAQRRDFYINALYADRQGHVFDPTEQGLLDAKSRRVRFIGDPHARIAEDYLRILRFFRFTIAYGHSLDEASFAACIALRSGLDRLSGERIQQELFKLLRIDTAINVIRVMIEQEVMSNILAGTKLRSNAETLTNLKSPDLELRFAALLYPDGLSALEAIAKRLRLSKALTLRLRAIADLVTGLPEAHDRLKPFIYKHGKRAIEDCLKLRAAQAGCKINIDSIDFDVPTFPLKSLDLIKAGIKAGPELGQTLKSIETAWLEADFSQTVIDLAIDDIRKRTNTQI